MGAELALGQDHEAAEVGSVASSECTETRAPVRARRRDRVARPSCRRARLPGAGREHRPPRRVAPTAGRGRRAGWIAAGGRSPPSRAALRTTTTSTSRAAATGAAILAVLAPKVCVWTCASRQAPTVMPRRAAGARLPPRGTDVTGPVPGVRDLAMTCTAGTPGASPLDKSKPRSATEARVTAPGGQPTGAGGRLTFRHAPSATGRGRHRRGHTDISSAGRRPTTRRDDPPSTAG